jgi:hypothetical protein
MVAKHFKGDAEVAAALFDRLRGDPDTPADDSVRGEMKRLSKLVERCRKK